MKRFMLSAVSATALMGLPMFAHAASQSSGTTAAQAIQTQAAGVVSSAHSVLLAKTLKSAGMNNENAVQGTVYTAQTSDGMPVVVVVTPADLSTRSAPNFDSQTFSKKLDQAGLKNVQPVEDANLVHGTLQGQQSHHDAVLAMSGLNMQSSSGNDNASFDQSAFRKTLSKAGIDSSSPLQAKLARANGPDGPVLMIVGQNGLMAENNSKPSHFDASTVRSSFQKAGLKNLSLLDNTHVYQGTTGDDSVFVLTGQGLAS